MAWKWSIVVTVLIIVIVFTAQNYELVQIKFMAWSFKSSSAITIFVSLVIGFIVGLLMCVKKD
ncbi:MAG: LapA family protein [Candidatus Omnitrophota bacterium]|nr:LapA family protein [Candidatus Omnitrophota bacterium]MBU1928816.1 LapA family protein [Candidatus Omnitrophota bacterium]MBU2035506.1 LapA family protein [Candidatus Omnitrophota bacterium]MBU2222132.1 LapA family protein [Candidatus Omnitrophota bacterium]MBU2257655.1 LapA family protein [Candidatus Omnitrophota bacterium]